MLSLFLAWIFYLKYRKYIAKKQAELQYHKAIFLGNELKKLEKQIISTNDSQIIASYKNKEFHTKIETLEKNKEKIFDILDEKLKNNLKDLKRAKEKLNLLQSDREELIEEIKKEFLEVFKTNATIKNINNQLNMNVHKALNFYETYKEAFVADKNLIDWKILTIKNTNQEIENNYSDINLLFENKKKLEKNKKTITSLYSLLNYSLGYEFFQKDYVENQLKHLKDLFIDNQKYKIIPEDVFKNFEKEIAQRWKNSMLNAHKENDYQLLQKEVSSLLKDTEIFKNTYLSKREKHLFVQNNLNSVLNSLDALIKELEVQINLLREKAQSEAQKLIKNIKNKNSELLENLSYESFVSFIKSTKEFKQQINELFAKIENYKLTQPQMKQQQIIYQELIREILFLVEEKELMLEENENQLLLKLQKEMLEQSPSLRNINLLFVELVPTIKKIITKEVLNEVIQKLNILRAIKTKVNAILNSTETLYATGNYKEALKTINNFLEKEVK
ncbi:hypothetical protein [Mycoplasma procyoni]|uniref:hypothetical protein n=1 Tax=Mycoplasma procyoni TaxID=568784 RepID=UPI00197C3BC2|nr:hypothetical protein [Mycoplasma procyoni]MBN3534811.1 hypothetical protein [Mycoplasma procyoni]